MPSELPRPAQGRGKTMPPWLKKPGSDGEVPPATEKKKKKLPRPMVGAGKDSEAGEKKEPKETEAQERAESKAKEKSERVGKGQARGPSMKAATMPRSRPSRVAGAAARYGVGKDKK